MSRHKKSVNTIVTSFNREEADYILRALNAYDPKEIASNIRRKVTGA